VRRIGPDVSGRPANADTPEYTGEPMGGIDEREKIHTVHLHVANKPTNSASKEVAKAVSLTIRYSRDGILFTR